MANDDLSLGDIVEELRQILELVQQHEQADGAASYEAIQAQLSSQLHLHILTYIRFLEGQAFLIYDRISDELAVPPAGQEAIDSPQTWGEAARQAFSEHLTEAEVAEENFLDEIASGIEEISAELQADGDGQREGSEPLDVGEDAADDESTVGQAPTANDGPGPPPEPPAASQPNSPPSYQHSPPTSHSETTIQRDIMNGHNHTQGQSRGGVSTPSTPSILDLYNRQEELGSGGVGTVYRASQSKLDRNVALKEINQVFNVFAGVKRDDIVAAFTEVVQQQASLVHPNIVQVLDVETEVEYPCVITQFAPRGNLRRLIEMDDRPALTVALKYFMQILAGLRTAHRADVVHGNLKPENVVMDAAGNAMLSDFGLSSIVEREGGNSSHVYVGVGTVAYMSPEQFQDPNAATVKSDIYSLGIMFYEMLTGKVPGRRSPMPSSFYPDIPRALDDIFDKMSMDGQEDRYDSIGAILQDLYEAEDVMDLLDSRSGVLFTRDPIDHGEIGGMLATAADSAVEDNSVSEASETAEDSSANDDAGGDLDSDLDDDSEPDEPADPDEVMDKLDEYGEMFEQEEA